MVLAHEATNAPLLSKSRFSVHSSLLSRSVSLSSSSLLFFFFNNDFVFSLISLISTDREKERERETYAKLKSWRKSMQTAAILSVFGVGRTFLRNPRCANYCYKMGFLFLFVYLFSYLLLLLPFVCLFYLHLSVSIYVILIRPMNFDLCMVGQLI